MSLNYHALIAELEAERTRLVTPIDAAIAALRVLCQDTPVVPPTRPVVARTATAAAKGAPATKAPRKAAGAGKWHKSVPDGHWREQALKALAMGHGDVQVRELATRLRIQGPTRDRSIAGLWNALQVLVKAGQVEKHGPLYRLPGQASGRGEAA